MILRTDIASPLLMDCLHKIMSHEAFNDYYLVGGTALALQRGHRISIDIDMFTNLLYGDMKTTELKEALTSLFPYVESLEKLDETRVVYSLFVGTDRNNCVKLDICYDENPVFPLIEVDGIRMVSEKDIAAMKLNAISQDRQRKKDFWDIHDLLESYPIDKLVFDPSQYHRWIQEITATQRLH